MENPAVTYAVIEATKKILTERSNLSSMRVDKAADFLAAVLQPYFESVYKAGVEAQLRTPDRRPEYPQGERIGRDLGKVERYAPPYMQVKVQRIIGDDRLQRAECIIENWMKRGFDLLWFQDQPETVGELSVRATIMIFKKEEK